MCLNPLLVCFVQTLQTGEKIVSTDNGAFLDSKCMKRAPEMTNDCGLKQAQTEREEKKKKNVFIRNYMWMARSAVMPFSAAECHDVNLCLVHKEAECKGTYREQNKPFFPLSFLYSNTHRNIYLLLSRSVLMSERRVSSFSRIKASCLINQLVLSFK